MREECLDCNKSLDDCTCIEDTIELPNQALIDAAERYIAGDNYNRYYDDFIEGAKWQQERMYSEEEVKRLAFDFYYDMSHKMGVPTNLISENATNVDVWFKQFKKK